MSAGAAADMGAPVRQPTLTLQLAFQTGWASGPLATARVSAYTHVLPGEQAARHADVLLRHYLGLPQLSCCDLRAGLEIAVGGRSWTDHCTDHLPLITHWIGGAEAVLRGGAQAETAIWVWDQSFLVLQRRGDTLTLYDRHITEGYRLRGEAGFAWAPITVGLAGFAARLIAAGAVYVALIEALAGAVAAHGERPTDLDALLAGRGDKPIAGPGDTRLRLAIIARELGRSSDAAALLGRLREAAALVGEG